MTQTEVTHPYLITLSLSEAVGCLNLVRRLAAAKPKKGMATYPAESRLADIEAAVNEVLERLEKRRKELSEG